MKSCLLFVILGAELHEVFAFTIHVPKGPRGWIALKANSQNPKLEFSVSGVPAKEFGVRGWMEKLTTRQGLTERSGTLWDKLKTKCKWYYPKWIWIKNGKIAFHLFAM